MRTAIILLAVELGLSGASLNNPLLDKSYRIPFDRIRAEHVEPAIAYLLEEAQKKRDAYVSSAAPRTYGNTMTALEDITEDLTRAMGIVQHLEAVATTPALRAAVGAVLPKYTAFESGLPLDRGVYAKLKEFAATPEAKALTGARKRFLEVKLDEFRRKGAELGDREQARLRAINVELSGLRKRYADNMLDATNAFELVIKDEARLAGLPAYGAGRGAGERQAQGPRWVAVYVAGAQLQRGADLPGRPGDSGANVPGLQLQSGGGAE